MHYNYQWALYNKYILKLIKNSKTILWKIGIYTLPRKLLRHHSRTYWKFNTYSVFADPPYLLSNGGFTVHAGKRVSVNKGEWDKSNRFKKDFEFHLKWIKTIKRVLKPHGTIWVSGTYHSIFQCGFALQLAGFHILNDIVWFKPNASQILVVGISLQVMKHWFGQKKRKKKNMFLITN